MQSRATAHGPCLNLLEMPMVSERLLNPGPCWHPQVFFVASKGAGEMDEEAVGAGSLLPCSLQCSLWKHNLTGASLKLAYCNQLAKCVTQPGHNC